MTESEAIIVLNMIETHGDLPTMAKAKSIEALEKQEKIKEVVANANQWSKEDVAVKAQAFCDIEKILRSDEE